MQIIYNAYIYICIYIYLYNTYVLCCGMWLTNRVCQFRYDNTRSCIAHDLHCFGSSIGVVCAKPCNEYLQSKYGPHEGGLPYPVPASVNVGTLPDDRAQQQPPECLPPPHKFRRLTVPKSQIVKSFSFLRYREECRQQEKEDQCRQQEDQCRRQKVGNLQTLKCPPSSPAGSSDSTDRAGRLLQQCWAIVKAGGVGQNRTLPQPASQPASPLPKGAGGKAASPPKTAGGAGVVNITLPYPPPRPKRALPPPLPKASRKGPSGGGRPITKGTNVVWQWPSTAIAE